MATRDGKKFDLQAEVDAIDRRRWARQEELARWEAQPDRLWWWIGLAFIMPIAVGVALGLAL